MKDHNVKLWSFLSVFLLAYLLVGCDTERVEYKDEDTYALLDGQSAAAPSAAELQHALEIIEFNRPIGDIPWAYSKILDFLGVGIEPEAIQDTMYTIQQVADMLDDAWVELASWLPPVDFVDEVLEIAVMKAGEDGFAPNNPENVALAALAYSLGNRGVTKASQVSGDTLLHHGDVLILLVCTSLSSGPASNALIDAIEEVLEDNNASTTGIPGIAELVEGATNTEVSIHHQGEGAGGSGG